MNYTHLFNFIKWNLYDSDPSDLSQHEQTKFIRSNGKVPTIIDSDNIKKWFKNGDPNGFLHRDEINHNTGFRCSQNPSNPRKRPIGPPNPIWDFRGLLTLPAVIYSNGDKFWYFEGKLHRELTDVDPETGLTLPAVIWSDGGKFWYVEGKQHRELTDIDPETGLTLPAVIWSDGGKFWYVEGKRQPDPY